MASELTEIRRVVDREFDSVRDGFEDIREAIDELEAAGPYDDLYGLLENLERVVARVRKGGLLSKGAKGHRRALEEYDRLMDELGQD